MVPTQLGFWIQLNVWLDIIFTALYVFVIAFLCFHFALFIKFGRFRKSFFDGVWPEHDSRPPATPKVLHAVHMTSMIILGFSGLYLRFPFFYGGRDAMRNTHYVFMIIVIVVLIWRVLYAFFSKKNADWREFAIGGADLKSALGVLAFYGYFSNNKPHVAKYNVLQKMSYSMFLVMMFVQAATGLLIWRFPFPIVNVSIYALTAGVAGGAGIWALRTVHYIICWLFIIMTTMHLYLAATVDVPCALDFFGVQELQVKPGGHGHGADAPSEPSPQLAPSA